ncbi:alkene reductase [Burkholderia sp. PAMC 28687]|uniref:N-ethylmaleimide reductase n=1 Tax=Caballeronia sordidicola TaxID=196367 RepID=A0A2C9XVX7_CABSO|nr:MULTISPECIES: alkene reductase [Burkholderiaceae]AMM16519.1 alkene reductase [Burkholderia sp. PAMC 28687]OTP65617.1 N-ethylmaleimide reductase [Caballeronia sordidicola]
MKKTYPTRSAEALFAPMRAGAFELANRVVMAPLTRNRAGTGLVPGPFALEYYVQRATAGLIIAEATQISAQAQGYAGTPGCYTDDQVRGWKKITDAVHAKGGKIVVQLWHTGRVSHTSFQPDGQAPVGPSAIRAKTKTFLAKEGFVDVSMPRALRLEEIAGIIEDFRHASMRAVEAGFDGVELHGAHGYLLDAFLRDGTNHRTDAYGGSIENRSKLLLEVTRVCADAIGADRLGVRLSPVSTAGDSRDSDPQALFEHVVGALNPLRLAYVHIVEGETGGARDSIAFDYGALHDCFDGVWMVNNGYDRQMAIDAVASGRADLVSFGRLFMANPDLVKRLRVNGPLNDLMGPETFYGGGAHGYIDYPTLEDSGAAIALA